MHNEFVIHFISGVILEVTLFFRYSALQLSATKRRNACSDAVNLTVTIIVYVKNLVICYKRSLLALADKLRFNNGYPEAGMSSRL